MKAASALDETDVVVLGPDFPDSFAENVAASLKDMRLRCHLLDPSMRFSKPGTMKRFSTPSRYIEELNRRSPRARQALVDRPVEQILKEADPKLVLSVFGYFEAEQVERWRRAVPNAVWALWYPDAVSNIGRQQMLEAPYDHLFFKDRYLVHQFGTRAGLSVHLLPQACNPSRHRTEVFRSEAERQRYSCDVAVVGNIYPHRALVLAAVPADTELRLYGNLYRNVALRHPRLLAAFSGEYVTRRTKALAFGGANIVLNTMHFAEVHGTNLRLFEATACGAFVLTHSIEGLADYFEPGREVAVFDSAAELTDAIVHYLADPDTRNTIAAAGQRRSHRDHSYEVRLRRLLQVCDLEDGLSCQP